MGDAVASADVQLLFCAHGNGWTSALGGAIAQAGHCRIKPGEAGSFEHLNYRRGPATSLRTSDRFDLPVIACHRRDWNHDRRDFHALGYSDRNVLFHDSP